MATLHDVFNEVKQLEMSISQRNIKPSDIKVLDSGEVQIHSERFQLKPEAQECIARLSGCPVNFFTLVPDDLKASIANRLLPQSELESITATVLDNSYVIGLSDARLICLSGAKVLEAAFDAMPDDTKMELDSLEVRHFSLSSDTLDLKITAPKASAELRVGDIVSAGISIYHSPVGIYSTQISTYLHRLVCTNGLMVPVCRNDKRLRVRRLDSTLFSKEEMLENIREISSIAWNELSIKLQAFAALSTKEADPEAVLANLVAQMHLNKRIGEALRNALYEDELGFDPTQLGVINALSRIATHNAELSRMIRRRLMEVAGVLSQWEIHRCPVCQSIVRQRIAA